MASDNKGPPVKFNQQVTSGPPLAKGSPSQKIGKSKKSAKKGKGPTSSPTGKTSRKSIPTGVSYSASCIHCQHMAANKDPPEKQGNGPIPFSAAPCNTVTCASVIENAPPPAANNANAFQLAIQQTSPATQSFGSPGMAQSPTCNDDTVKKVLNIGKLVSNKFSAVMQLQRELDRKLKLCLEAKSGQEKAHKGTREEKKPAHPEVKGSTHPPKDNSAPPGAAPTQGAAVKVDGANKSKK